MANGSRAVTWSRDALDCLNEIVGTIARDSPRAAARVLDVFDSTAASLSELAERGRIVPELQDSWIREVFVYRYRVMYQVTSDEVRILAVVPGEMDYLSRLRKT